MLLSRVIMIVVVLLIFACGTFFFASSGSYQNSLQSRVEYFLGNYEEALVLAKKAYEQDRYNKMAFAMITQSQISLRYKTYLIEGEKYLNQINSISQKTSITKSDKSKIKIICEVMIEDYKNLTPTKMTSDSLIKNSKNMSKRFSQIYNELF